ncbi:MAG: sulfite exporter TauE/SafE family protein [Cyanosarcina radialis HA8281-LM2]|jgi:hypothetical protein|nr:sulfite exporter TauE/SafE family protein [Cyanosarcina radialis HA8281-LM2]
MLPANGWLLAAGGLISGILAGLLGIGGGTVLVPILVALGYTPIQSVATSSLAILITSSSGTVQNWRMGVFDRQRIIYLGIPAAIAAQIGVFFAKFFAPYLLLAAFGAVLITNIYLLELRQRLTKTAADIQPQNLNPVISRVLTGSAGGVLAGLFGLGGGVIMVPLQIWLLGEPIKVAIQTSLGAIVITAISASVGHALSGNVLFAEGIILGIGGAIAAQVSTRILPKLGDQTVSSIFRTFLAVLSIYIFWQAWRSYELVQELRNTRSTLWCILETCGIACFLL